MTDEEIRQAFDEAMSSIPHGHQVAIARYVVSLKDKADKADSNLLKVMRGVWIGKHGEEPPREAS